MKILVVTPHPAKFPGGGSPARVFFLLRALAENHKVDLIAGECWGGQNDPLQLAPLCSRFAVVRPQEFVPEGSTWRRRLNRWYRWWFGPPTDVRDVSRIQARVLAQLEEWGGTEQYDRIYLHHSMSFELLRSVNSKGKIFVDLHNIMHEYYWRNFRSSNGWREKLNALREYCKQKSFEGNLFRKNVLFVVCSDADRTRILRLEAKARVVTVPNGVDTTYFDSAPGGSERQILFLGTLSYLPNAEAVRFFVSRIWPALYFQDPTLRFRVVGMDPPADLLDMNSLSGVEVLGAVPDVRPYTLESAIHVVPLLSGSGTRLKILEALAQGRAVVSTSIGAEGLDLVDNEHLYIADTVDAFIAKTLRLTRDSEKRELLGTKGRARVREKYGWEKIGEGLRAEIELES